MNDVPSTVDFIQASRVLRIHSPLGDDVLLPERARIVEGVNELFEITASVRSKQEIAASDLIGKLVSRIAPMAHPKPPSIRRLPIAMP